MPFSQILRWYRQLIRNPKYRPWIILGTLAYLFSPIDISPDVFPIVGQIDDLAILTLLISEVAALLFGDGQEGEAEIPDLDPEQAAAVERDKQEAIDVEAAPIDDRQT